MRLVQLTGPRGRRVALVEEPRLHLLEGCRSVYDLASACLDEGVSLAVGIERRTHTNDFLDYESVYAGRSDWRLCPSADVPAEPARCLVSGTGLTHKGQRQES